MSEEIIYHSGNCPNCGNKLHTDANYCSVCGQKTTTHKIGFFKIIREFLEEYISLDSKLIRTLVPLLIRPGFLTNNFCEGKRTLYVHPIRLYLFISFCYFFLVSLNVGSDGKNESPDLFDGSGVSFSIGTDDVKYESMADFREDVNSKGMSVYLDSLGVDNKLEALMVTQFYKITQSDSRSISQYILKNVSIMMFFLMPIFAALLMLLHFRKSKLFYVEHLMHSLHIHSFLFVMLSLYTIISWIKEPVLGTVLIFLLISIYTIKSTIVVYDNKAIKAIVKYLVLLSFYSVLMSVVFGITLLVSLALY